MADLVALLALVNIELYAGCYQQAWEQVAEAWPKIKRSLILRTTVQLRIEALFLYGRAVLGNAKWRPAKRARIVRRIARRLSQVARPWAQVLAGLLRSCAFRLTRKDDCAIVELARVALLAQRAEMQLHEAVARWCWADIAGGAEGKEQQALATALLAKQAFRRPDRLVAMLAPVFFNRSEKSA
jgi:hypothetical protein